MEILLDLKIEGNPKNLEYVRAVRESGGLGDIVRCIAVCQGLRLKYPEARVHFFGARYLQQLVAPRSKAFDLYIPCENHARPRDAELDETIYPHLEVGIEYKDSIDCFCPAYLEEPATEGVVCQERTELWCSHGGVPLTRPKLTPLPQDLNVFENMKNKYQKSVGIQVGATCRSREWPFENWGKLIKMFKREGYHVYLFDVCFRWTDFIDFKDVEAIVNGPWSSVIGRILSTDLMITPDSGFYHLCGALNQRTLGLFGPTSGQVISRIWNREDPTHHFLQVDHDSIDHDELPKTSSSNRPCKPICYQRWERGWDSERYRQKGEYCALIKMLTPDLVFNHAMGLILDPYDNRPKVKNFDARRDHKMGFPHSMVEKTKRWKNI